MHKGETVKSLLQKCMQWLRILMYRAENGHISTLINHEDDFDTENVLDAEYEIIEAV